MAWLNWEMLHPRMTHGHLGHVLLSLNDNDKRSAAEQINTAYAFGGWCPFQGFRLGKDNSLNYPGDPPQMPLAQARLRDELVVFYASEWVAVIQKDRSFEVARID